MCAAQVLEDLRRVVREPDFTPASHQEIANRVLHTTYMGTRNRWEGTLSYSPSAHQEWTTRRCMLVHVFSCFFCSSSETRNRAKRLAEEIGAYHLDTNVDSIVDPMKHLVSQTLGVEPRFRSEGGGRFLVSFLNVSS